VIAEANTLPVYVYELLQKLAQQQPN